MREMIIVRVAAQLLVGVITAVLCGRIVNGERARRRLAPYRQRARDRRAPFHQEGMPWDPERQTHTIAWGFYDRLERAKQSAPAQVAE